jgi:hypothetical protein
MPDDKDANIAPSDAGTDQALSKYHLSKGFIHMHEYFMLALLHACVAGGYLVLFLRVRM